MSKILDYSNYIKESGFQDHDMISPSSNTHLFFNNVQDNCCPFCRIKTKIVYEDSFLTYPLWLDGGHYSAKEYVEFCENCGWWKSRCHKITSGDIDARSIEIHNAILKEYNLDDKTIPINVLQKYLKGNFQDVIHIMIKKWNF